MPRRTEGSSPPVDDTEAFFDELAERGHEPLMGDVTGSMRFDLSEGRETRRWLVALERGVVSVSRRNVRADCIVRADRALFDRLVTGRANAMAAVLRGEIQPEGDVELLVFFQRLFPAPRRPRRRRRAERQR